MRRGGAIAPEDIFPPTPMPPVGLLLALVVELFV